MVQDLEEGRDVQIPHVAHALHIAEERHATEVVDAMGETDGEFPTEEGRHLQQYEGRRLAVDDDGGGGG